MEALTILRRLGFFDYEQALPTLAHTAAKMAAAAGGNGPEPRFEAWPTYIPVSPPSRRHPLVLSLHIGAGGTRAAVRQSEGEDRQRWRFLFAASHHDLRPPDSKHHCFEYFADLIARRTADAVAALGIRRRSLEACGAVWVNPLENLPIDGRGITGRIIYREGYHKGEWFLTSARNGFDIGLSLLAALDHAGIHIKKFIVCNNAPLIMKALVFADGGVSLSRGLNGTLVKPLPQRGRQAVVCNAEMGSRWQIPEPLLTRADLIDDRRRAQSMENLCAGWALPRLLAQYIITLDYNGCAALAPLSRRLFELGTARWTFFDAKDLIDLLAEPSAFSRRHTDPDLFSRDAVHTLTEIVRALTIRAARLGAVAAYATVSCQLEEKESCTVALDSFWARSLPFFLDNFKRSLIEITPARRTIDLRLLEPLAVDGGEITVPMLGSGHAVDNLLDRA